MPKAYNARYQPAWAGSSWGNSCSRLHTRSNGRLPLHPSVHSSKAQELIQSRREPTQPHLRSALRQTQGQSSQHLQCCAVEPLQCPAIHLYGSARLQGIDRSLQQGVNISDMDPSRKHEHGGAWIAAYFDQRFGDSHNTHRRNRVRRERHVGCILAHAPLASMQGRRFLPAHGGLRAPHAAIRFGELGLLTLVTRELAFIETLKGRECWAPLDLGVGYHCWQVHGIPLLAGT